MVIINMLKEEIIEYLLAIGEKKFRGNQIYEWLHVKLTENFEELDVTVCLESLSKKFEYIKGYTGACTEFNPEKTFDLCITLDVSDVKRLGAFAPYLETSGYSLCIDHHVTNAGLANVNVVDADASSCCEVLYGLLDPEMISKAVAECFIAFNGLNSCGKGQALQSCTTHKGAFHFRVGQA